jgi:hypothetical protein
MRDVWKDNERRWRLAQMKRMRDRANWPANAKAKAIRLARRYEAIKRLLADPRAAVLTLARRLRKLGAGAYLAARRIARAIVPRYIRERDPTCARWCWPTRRWRSSASLLPIPADTHPRSGAQRRVRGPFARTANVMRGPAPHAPTHARIDPGLAAAPPSGNG